jgi:hypothetical protein
MWRGFTAALVAYGLAMCAEWDWRGRADAVAPSLLELTGGVEPDPALLAGEGRLPPWIGLEALHVSHRSALVRKLPEHYRAYFPDVPDDLPYVWPPSVFPRWPVRRRRVLRIDEALTELGWTDTRPGQREAIDQLSRGHDVTLRWAAGAGATSTGLLAALCLEGPTVWVSPHVGGSDFTAPPLPAVRREPTPVRSSRTSPSIARPPTKEDRRSVKDEWSRPSEFYFYSATTWRRNKVDIPPTPGLLVLDGVPRARTLSGVPTLRILASRSQSSPPTGESPAG